MLKGRGTSYPKVVLLYGFLLGVVLVGIKLFEYSYLARHISLDLYLGIVALVFLAVGVIVGFKSRRAPSLPVLNSKEEGDVVEIPSSSSSTFTIPGTAITTELSERELQVLTHIAEGRTNPEIAEVLFLSPNTIKTHVSNIYRKLDVERRAQAVARAKELKILN